MSEDDRNNPEVKENTPIFQLLFLNEFAGFGRPVELVPPVAVNMPNDKNGEADVWEDDP
ncbi:hypothetical protein D3C87_1833830 [compost metagenome]